MLNAERPQQWLEALLNITEELVIFYRADGRILGASRAARRVLGLSSEAMRGFLIGAIVLPPAQSGRSPHWTDPRSRDGLLRQADGRSLPVQLTISAAAPSRTGAVNAEAETYVLVARDRTQAIHDGWAQQSMEDHFRASLDAAARGVGIISARGDWVRANRPLAQLLGCDEAQLVGRSLSTFVHADDQRAVVEVLACLLNDELPEDTCELRLRALGAQSTTQVEFGARLLRRQDGRPGSFVITVEPTAERRAHARSEQRVTELEAWHTVASHGVHDLANTLTIAASEASAEGRRFALAEAVSLVARLQESAPTLPGSRQQPADVVLGRVATRARRALDADIELVFEAPEGLRAPVSAALLEQSALGMVMQAARSMRHGGRLTVAATHVELDRLAARLAGAPAPGCYLQISVADEGDGSTRVEASTPAFELARRHGGVLRVHGATDRGATSRLLLPVSTGARGSEGTLPRGDGARLLVVDCDVDAREALVEALTGLGYVVQVASTVLQALDMVARAPFHLVLSEVMLPGMTGVELACEMANRDGPPTLLMSGCTYDQLSVDLDGGAHHALLEKPFNRRELAIACRSALSHEVAVTVPAIPALVTVR